MQIGDIIQIIVSLSKVRKLFWSEDDFKFAFATQVQLKFGKAAEVRLEKRYKGEKDKNSYTDIVVRLNGKNFPIELKYKTVKGSYADFGNEVVELMTHSAVDLGCYAYLKDINRLEYLAKNDPDFERGFAIILTNEPLYFKDTGRRSVYEAFKIYDGKVVTECLDWDRSNYDLEKLPYKAAGSLSILPGPAAILLMIVSISAGVTMKGFFRKCLMLPVTRNESSLFNATS